MVAATTMVALISLGYVEVPDCSDRTSLLGTPTALEVTQGSMLPALGCAVLLAMALCAPNVNRQIRRRRAQARHQPPPDR